MAEGRARIAEFRPRHFPRYPDYKDSDVEWLGEIPAHWERYRLRWTVNGCQNGVWGDEADGMNDTICVRVADFNRTQFLVNLHDPTLRSIDPRIADTRLLKKKDLLLEKSGGGEKQPVGAVVMYNHRLPAVCSNFVARMPVAEGHHPRYLTYLHAALYTARINTRSIKQSTGIQNLDGASYLSEYVGTPGDREQCEIAGFLDRETAKIDALVAKKERLVELLLEKRTALITSAVTRGLDSSVPMKDSGVEWLGEIPAHWGVKRLRHLLHHIEQGWSPSCENREASADEWGVLKAGCVNRGVFLASEHKALPSTLTPIPGLEVRQGDLLMSRASGSRDLIGSVAVVPKCRPHLLLCDKVFRLHTTSSAAPRQFLGYAMNSRIVRWQIESVISGGGGLASNISQEAVKDIVVVQPPRTERQKVVGYLDRETVRIDALMAQVHQAIDHLTEYRTALISAAVTGKIDVRKDAA